MGITIRNRKRKHSELSFQIYHMIKRIISKYKLGLRSKVAEVVYRNKDFVIYNFEISFYAFGDNIFFYFFFIKLEWSNNVVRLI